MQTNNILVSEKTKTLLMAAEVLKSHTPKKMYVMKVLPQKAEARTQTLMSAAVTKRHFIPALNMLWRHFSKGYKGTFYSSNAGKFRKMQNLI